MRSIFRPIDFDQSSLPKITWVGLRHSWKLKEREGGGPLRKREFSSRLTWGSNINSSLSLQPAILSYRFYTCQPHNCIRKFIKINLFLSIYICVYALLVLFLWGTLIIQEPQREIPDWEAESLPCSLPESQDNQSPGQEWQGCQEPGTPRITVT